MVHRYQVVAILALGWVGAPASSASSRWQRFTATAYAEAGETASGRSTRDGRTVAADPSILPLGTKIAVHGAGRYSGIYRVDDSGPKVKGHEVDIFMTSRAEAKKFGRKSVRLRIIDEAPKKQSAQVR